MAAPMLSAGLITAETLQISGAQAGAIQATNFDFDNLNTTINGVSSTVKGSRKIAESPFHLPSLRGKYAVDMHNVVQWHQNESCLAIPRRYSPSYLNDAYESTGRTLEYVSDTVPVTVNTDGSGYDVPTKYGIKRLAFEDGDCFYDSSKQIFVTPPQPLHMTLFIPSTRDKTEEFNFYESNNPVNYYPLEYSGDPEILFIKNWIDRFSFSAGESFYDDIAEDSVYHLLLNYNFSSFDDSDVPKDINGDSLFTTVISDILDSQSVASESDNNRYSFIKNVFTLFVGNLNISVRVKSLLEAIKSTGSYQRMMSYKWNVKRHTSYTTTDHVISTDLSLTTRPYGDLPVHITQDGFHLGLVDMASRGIVCIFISYDYCWYSHRIPNTNNDKIMEGANIFTAFQLNMLNDTTERIMPGDRWCYTDINGNRLENGKLITDGYYTSIGSIEYIKELFKKFHSEFVRFGFIDLLRVSTEGFSGNGMWGSVSNIITKNDSLFPLKFKCSVMIDTITSLPWSESDVNGDGFGEYFGTGIQPVLPNGHSIPVLWFDETHAAYDMYHDQNNFGVGDIRKLQTQFRKTPVSVRAECIYHEGGDVHIRNLQLNMNNNTQNRWVVSYGINTVSTGIDYPDDAFNNLTFNESLISTEQDLVMITLKYHTATSLFVCRHLLPDFPVSKEMIKAILPGTSTISPWTLDDAGEFLDNAIINESIKMPKVITMYDSSVYDFSHNMPGKSTYCFDLSKITSINQSFNLQGLPTDEISRITVTTRGVTYNDASGQVSEYTPLSTIISYVPHADMDGFADTSGIDFVRGDAPNGSWKIIELDGQLCFVSGDVGEIGTPGDDGSVIMNITIPEVSGDNVLSFVAIASSETNYDFLVVYINDEIIETLSGDTRSDYNIPVVTGDIIKIAYSKDYIYSSKDDVIYIKNLAIRTGGNYNTINVDPLTKPKCDFLVTLADESSTTTSVTLPDVKATPVVISPNDVVRSVQIIPKDNLVTSGKLIVNVEYLKIPPADSVIILNI